MSDDLDPDPDPRDLVLELRDVLGLARPPLPISPADAWAEALEMVRQLKARIHAHEAYHSAAAVVEGER